MSLSYFLFELEENSENEDEYDWGGLGHCVERYGDVLEAPLRKADVQSRERGHQRHVRNVPEQKEYFIKVTKKTIRKLFKAVYKFDQMWKKIES